MNRKGEWRLSPAYDVAYAYNPSGTWTRDHQMSMAGKRDDFTRADLLEFAASSGLKKTVAARILDDVVSAVSDWQRLAAQAGVADRDAKRIARTHRTSLASSVTNM